MTYQGYLASQGLPSNSNPLTLPPPVNTYVPAPTPIVNITPVVTTPVVVTPATPTINSISTPTPITNLNPIQQAAYDTSVNNSTFVPATVTPTGNTIVDIVPVTVPTATNNGITTVNTSSGDANVGNFIQNAAAASAINAANVSTPVISNNAATIGNNSPINPANSGGSNIMTYTPPNISLVSGNPNFDANGNYSVAVNTSTIPIGTNGTPDFTQVNNVPSVLSTAPAVNFTTTVPNSDYYKIGDAYVAANDWDNASDASKFNMLQAQGQIPAGSLFIPALTQAEIDALGADGKGLAPTSWGYYTPEQIQAQQTSLNAQGGKFWTQYQANAQIIAQNTATNSANAAALNAYNKFTNYIDNPSRDFKAPDGNYYLDKIVADPNVSASDIKLYFQDAGVSALTARMNSYTMPAGNFTGASSPIVSPVHAAMFVTPETLATKTNTDLMGKVTWVDDLGKNSLTTPLTKLDTIMNANLLPSALGNQTKTVTADTTLISNSDIPSLNLKVGSNVIAGNSALSDDNSNKILSLNGIGANDNVWMVKTNTGMTALFRTQQEASDYATSLAGTKAPSGISAAYQDVMGGQSNISLQSMGDSPELKMVTMGLPIIAAIDAPASLVGFGMGVSTLPTGVLATGEVAGQTLGGISILGGSAEIAGGIITPDLSFQQRMNQIVGGAMGVGLGGAMVSAPTPAFNELTQNSIFGELRTPLPDVVSHAPIVVENEAAITDTVKQVDVNLNPLQIGGEYGETVEPVGISAYQVTPTTTQIVNVPEIDPLSLYRAGATDVFSSGGKWSEVSPLSEVQGMEIKGENAWGAVDNGVAYDPNLKVQSPFSATSTQTPLSDEISSGIVSSKSIPVDNGLTSAQTEINPKSSGIFTESTKTTPTNFNYVEPIDSGVKLSNTGRANIAKVLSDANTNVILDADGQPLVDVSSSYFGIDGQKGGGFKLHVYGANSNDAAEIVSRIEPYMKENNIQFKVGTQERFNLLDAYTKNGVDLENLDTHGLYQLDQGGKAVTIYIPDNLNPSSVANDVVDLMKGYTPHGGIGSFINDENLNNYVGIRYEYDVNGKYVAAGKTEPIPSFVQDRLNVTPSGTTGNTDNYIYPTDLSGISMVRQTTGSGYGIGGTHTWESPTSLSGISFVSQTTEVPTGKITQTSLPKFVTPQDLASNDDFMGGHITNNPQNAKGGQQLSVDNWGQASGEMITGETDKTILPRDLILNPSLSGKKLGSVSPIPTFETNEQTIKLEPLGDFESKFGTIKGGDVGMSSNSPTRMESNFDQPSSWGGNVVGGDEPAVGTITPTSGTGTSTKPSTATMTEEQLLRLTADDEGNNSFNFIPYMPLVAFPAISVSPLTNPNRTTTTTPSTSPLSPSVNPMTDPYSPFNIPTEVPLAMPPESSPVSPLVTMNPSEFPVTPLVTTPSTYTETSPTTVPIGNVVPSNSTDTGISPIPFLPITNPITNTVPIKPITQTNPNPTEPFEPIDNQPLKEQYWKPIPPIVLPKGGGSGSGGGGGGGSDTPLDLEAKYRIKPELTLNLPNPLENKRYTKVLSKEEATPAAFIRRFRGNRSLGSIL